MTVATAKQQRRAKKKANKSLKPPVERCEGCGWKPWPGGDHDSAYSRGGWCWDGFVVVAWCPMCGYEYCS